MTVNFSFSLFTRTHAHQFRSWVICRFVQVPDNNLTRLLEVCGVRQGQTGSTYVFFLGGGGGGVKTGVYPEKSLWGKDENHQQAEPRCHAEPGKQTQATLVDGDCCPAPSLLHAPFSLWIETSPCLCFAYVNRN